ncbi:hypothetical protein FRB95_008904 [Tulasnella sp. JGI-2019a]|nr:hypothetical protein FRB95_008904 [Tulasnella sp. JGI-2019a]
MSAFDKYHLILRTALGTLGAYQIYSRLNIDMNSVIGRGGFGIVRRAHLDSSEQVVAAKILRSDESKDIRVAKRLIREMKIWSGLRHENVLRLLGFHLSESLDLAIIVCPLVPHGSIADYVLREMPGDACRLRLARNTLNGLIYLHGISPPVIHGDIKANALVNQELRAVLSDFGLSVAASVAPSGLTTSLGLQGSIRWWSPELFDDKPRTTSSDIWAWAGLSVEVMKDRVPYSWIKDNVSVVKAVMSGVLPEHKAGLEYPLNLWPVTEMCWEVNQEKRATGIKVLKKLDTLISTVEGVGASEVTKHTSELSLATQAVPGKHINAKQQL